MTKRRWLALLVSEGHGIISPVGTDYQGHPEWYERVEVEEVSEGWIDARVCRPAIGQYVQLFSNGVVQQVNPMYDEDEEGAFWHYHGILDHNPALQDEDMWIPLPEGPR